MYIFYTETTTELLPPITQTQTIGVTSTISAIRTSSVTQNIFNTITSTERVTVPSILTQVQITTLILPQQTVISTLLSTRYANHLVHIDQNMFLPSRWCFHILEIIQCASSLIEMLLSAIAPRSALYAEERRIGGASIACSSRQHSPHSERIATTPLTSTRPAYHPGAPCDEKHYAIVFFLMRAQPVQHNLTVLRHRLAVELYQSQPDPGYRILDHGLPH